MGLIPVPGDEIATIVTTLEMRRRPPLRPLPESSLRLERWDRPSPARYRALFARVGAPWLWFSRLAMAEDMLRAIIHDPGVEIHAVVDRAGIEVGMLELDFRAPAECELSYFGLVPELAGQGHGRWLMAEAMARAWRPGIARVWVHTCTLDHPSALNFYRAQGFEAIARTIETFPDPRVSGLLPIVSAPQIPRLAKARQATTPSNVSASSQPVCIPAISASTSERTAGFSCPAARSQPSSVSSGLVASQLASISMVVAPNKAKAPPRVIRQLRAMAADALTG